MITVKLFYVYVNIYFVHLQCIKGDLFLFSSGMRAKDYLNNTGKASHNASGIILAQWD